MIRTAEDDNNIRTILLYIDEIRDVFVDIGIPQSHLNFRKSKIDKGRGKELIDCIKNLKKYKCYVIEYWRIKSLLPQKQWDFYTMMGIAGTLEQKELDGIINVLKIEWKKRPNIIKAANAKCQIQRRRTKD